MADSQGVQLMEAQVVWDRLQVIHQCFPVPTQVWVLSEDQHTELIHYHALVQLTPAQDMRAVHMAKHTTFHTAALRIRDNKRQILYPRLITLGMTDMGIKTR